MNVHIIPSVYSPEDKLYLIIPTKFLRSLEELIPEIECFLADLKNGHYRVAYELPGPDDDEAE